MDPDRTGASGGRSESNGRTGFGTDGSRVRETVRTLLNGTVATARRLRGRHDGEPVAPTGRPESVLGADRDDWPTVGIVVLTWENYEEASDCLDSLTSVAYPNYRVIVVDNGSQDGSVESLKSEYDWCEFVCNDENLGFAGGNNVGIEYALETGVDYVLLLNDDTIVPADFLTPLVETMEGHERVAAVGGLNRNASTGDIHNAGYEFYPSLGGRAIRYVEPRDVCPYPVGYVQACLILLDPEFLSDIGLLSDQYFLGLEDVDLAWKARRNGWQVLTDPASEIAHRIGATDERGPFNVYHRTRNRLQFASDNLSLSRKILFSLSFAAFLAFAALSWGLDGDWRKVQTSMLGVVDYVTGREFRSYDELV